MSPKRLYGLIRPKRWPIIYHIPYVKTSLNIKIV
jgi:hypothetical protein